MTSLVTSWSYSAFELYQRCPAAYKYAKIDKLPDPPSKALLNGRVKHKDVENYLKDPKDVPVPAAGKLFDWLLPALKAEPHLLVEQQWAFGRDWRETRWFKDDRTWLRSVLDAGVIYDDMTVELIDWKTGKYYGTNEDQVELFALTAMVRYPQAPKVMTRLAYLDNGQQVTAEYDSKDREALRAKWEKKVAPLFREETWAAKPNDKCGWCNFSRSKGGPCRYG
jgi:RecB family exonuclease